MATTFMKMINEQKVGTINFDFVYGSKTAPNGFEVNFPLSTSVIEIIKENTKQQEKKMLKKMKQKKVNFDPNNVQMADMLNIFSEKELEEITDNTDFKDEIIESLKEIDELDMEAIIEHIKKTTVNEEIAKQIIYNFIDAVIEYSQKTLGF